MPTDELDAFDRLYLDHGLVTTWDGSITMLAGQRGGWRDAGQLDDEHRGPGGGPRGMGHATTVSRASRTAPPGPRMSRRSRPSSRVAESTRIPPKDAILLRGARALGWEAGADAPERDRCGDCGSCPFGCPPRGQAVRHPRPPRPRVRGRDPDRARCRRHAGPHRARSRGRRRRAPRRRSPAHRCAPARSCWPPARCARPAILAAIRRSATHRSGATCAPSGARSWRAGTTSRSTCGAARCRPRDRSSSAAREPGGTATPSNRRRVIPGSSRWPCRGRGRAAHDGGHGRLRHARAADRGDPRRRRGKRHPDRGRAASGSTIGSTTPASRRCATASCRWPGSPGRRVRARSSRSGRRRVWYDPGGRRRTRRRPASPGSRRISRRSTSPRTVVPCSRPTRWAPVRMGAEAGRTPCDPWGRVRVGGRGDAVVRGLYVGDASVFPTGVGVNPMITVMALARRARAGDPRRDLRVRPPRAAPVAAGSRGRALRPPLGRHGRCIRPRAVTISGDGDHDDRAGDDGPRPDGLLEDDRAEDDRDDRVDVGVGGHERERRLAQQPAERRERDEAADDGQVAERRPATTLGDRPRRRDDRTRRSPDMVDEDQAAGSIWAAVATSGSARQDRAMRGEQRPDATSRAARGGPPRCRSARGRPLCPSAVGPTRTATPTNPTHDADRSPAAAAARRRRAGRRWRPRPGASRSGAR